MKMLLSVIIDLKKYDLNCSKFPSLSKSIIIPKTPWLAISQVSRNVNTKTS